MKFLYFMSDEEELSAMDKRKDESVYDIFVKFFWGLFQNKLTLPSQIIKTDANRVMRSCKCQILVLFLSLLCVNKGFAQCGSIDFKNDMKVTKACPPAQVKFTCTGAPSGSSFSWDFGAGSVSGKDTIYKIFTTSGKYTVTLKVTLSGGTICTIVKKDMFEILPAPTPIIGVVPGRFLCDGTRKLTLIDSTPNSVKRDWVIDGTSYLDTVPKIVDSFTSIGAKSVTLRVTNSYGCVGIFSDNKYIVVSNPASVPFCTDVIQNATNFKVKDSCHANLSGRTITHYKWDFPGGTPSSDTTSSPPVITYPSASKKYDQTLTVTTSDGCTYKTSYKDHIEPSISVKPDSACINSPFHLIIDAKGPNKMWFNWVLYNDVLSHGNDTAWFSQPGYQSPELTFIYPGNGCTNTVKLPNGIKVIGTKADFSSPKRMLCTTSDTVTLLWNSASFGGGTPTYKWEFFDTLGKAVTFTPIGSGTGPKLKGFLPKQGVFDVKLTVKTSSGCLDTMRKYAYIVIRKPIVDFIADSPEVCLGKSIKLSNLTTPPDDKKNPYTYSWTLEDADSPAISITSSAKDLTFTATHPAAYNVTLAVSTNLGCADTVVKSIYLKVNGFVARLIPRGAVKGCPPLSSHVSLKILERYPDTATNLPKLTWTSKPTKGVTISNASDTGADFALAAGGCYALMATLMDSMHCSKDVSTSVCPGVGAAFKVSNNNCLGSPTKIFNSSSNNPDHYKWTVTPSSGAYFSPSDTLQAPDIIYTKDTSFTIKLVTYKTYFNGTCTDTADTFVAKLAVGKLDFDVLGKDTVYCAPTAVKLLNKSKDVFTFTWYFGDGDSFSNTRKDPTTVGHLYFVNNPKGFNITLRGVDTIGCVLTKTKFNVMHVIGPAPGFKISARKGCDSLFVKFTDSSQNIHKFVMNYDDGSPQDTVTIHDHFYKLSSNTLDSQYFYPTMVAIDASNCKSFYKDSVKLYRAAVPDFSVPNTSGCPPFNVKFSNLSLRARKFYWDLDGDGVVDDSTKNPLFVYKTPGDYTVTLTVKNAGGCSETITKTAYIHVIANPIVDLRLSEHHVCGADAISYKNKSSLFTDYSYNFGDGSPKDSDVLKSHVYTYKGPLSSDSSRVVSKFTVYNSIGCSAIQYDTITLYRKPDAGFKASPLVGCEPLKVNFTDTTRGSVKRLWDFENDGKIDDSIISTQKTFSYGLYSVKLLSYTATGCSDTALMKNLVNVLPKPIADFAPSDTLICPKETVIFTDRSKTIGTIVKYDWKFNESAAASDVDTASSPSFTYLSAGLHAVRLEITNDNGCKDTMIFQYIHVKDSLAPTASKLLYVTVLDSAHIRVVWQKSNMPWFGAYTLQRDSSTYTSTNRKDTNYVDFMTGGTSLNTNARSYCYSLTSATTCNKTSTDPQNHCSMWLTATPRSGISIFLQWTGYTGWYDLGGYKIFRSEDGKPFVFLADVPAGNINYVDTNLCLHKYCYYIVASRISASYTSSSNTACATPPYVFQADPIYLHTATVDDGATISVLWQKSIQPNVYDYAIDRFDPKLGWTYGYLNTPDTFMTDAKVNVNIESYAYRVRESDKCGNFSPLSNFGKTILLKNYVKDDKISLYWSNYKDWSGGVSNSVVQLKYHDNNFVNIATVPGTDTSFIYDKVFTQSDTAYCFRIVSHAALANDSSTSNTSCAILPSRAFVANAFTPNNDGLNDVWLPSTLFVNNYVNSPNAYSLKIYDRWGEKVFESSDLNTGWDGTTFNGMAGAGVYIYIIRAEGLDGKSFYFRGNITVLK